MPPANQPEIDRLVANLLNAYETAGDRVQAELLSIINNDTKQSRRARLKQLAAEIDNLKASLDRQVAAWTADELRSIYALGGAVTADVTGVDFSWNQSNEAALKTLASDTLSTMLSATTHMKRDAKRLIRAASREASFMEMVLGKSVQKASRELASQLGKNGIAAVVYKDGSRHSLSDYADMNLRTVTANAYNKGTLVEGKNQGMKYAIAYDGLECGLSSHEGSPKANNLIVAIGKAMENLISHPRCRRSWSPVPGIASPKQAQQAMSDGTYATKASQDAAQAEADAVRLGAQRNAAKRRARETRKAARAQKLRSA